jgi:hypothetical protein
MTTANIINEFSELSLKKNEENELKLNDLLKILTDVYNKHDSSSEKKPKKEKTEKKLSAYNLFMKEKLPELKKENPESNIRELMSQVAKLWNEKKEQDKK